MRKALIGLIAFIFILPMNTKLHADDYKKHAKEIRDEVWSWDNPVFKNYTIPDEYKTESIVVLARHRQIQAISKKKFRIAALLTYSMGDSELYYNDVDRRLVKLNDKKALDEYSELSFKEEVKTFGTYRFNQLKTVLGVRIIKPDGTINEIDVDEDAVAITEGKKDKEAFKKIAIKGLEVGDVIDYFYSNDMELESENIPFLTIDFYSKYPTLNYAVECVFGKNLTIEYRAINGAPDFEQSVDEDGDTILKVAKNNLTVIDDLDNMRWLSAYRELPMICLRILNNASKQIYKPNSARKKGVYKNVGYEDILKDAEWSSYGWVSSDYEFYKKTKNALKAYKKKNPSASNSELTSYAYDALRFYGANQSINYLSSVFFTNLKALLADHKINTDYYFDNYFVTTRYGARKDEVVEAGDLNMILKTNGDEELFLFCPNQYGYVGEFPSVFEGEIASTAPEREKSRKSNTLKEITMPTSSFEDNKTSATLNITFSDSNPLELKIKREMVLSGSEKRNNFGMFVSYEDWDKVMRKRLMLETDLWEDIAKDKYTSKRIDELKSNLEDQEKELDKNKKKEFKEYHSIDSGELLSFTVTKTGIIKEEPTFEFETQYMIDGLVKKAGDNLILDAGKLIGSQWVPTDKERNRDWNAYRPAANSIDNEITIEIPIGYTIDGVENLNKNIDNEYGKFTSSATVEGNKLKISTTKIYKTNFIPKEKWSTLLDMIDVTNDFFMQSVILKSK